MIRGTFRTLLAAAAVAVLSIGSAGQTDDVATGRELAAIAEEQALLLRQTQRLRSTMEVLLQRIEAEGRARTAELLREALRLLDERSTGAAGTPLTVEERMEQAQAALESRQPVLSLERQAELVNELERLLSILLDRKNLEALEDKIAELRELREAADELANQESELREETAELREEASNEAQDELEASLGELYRRQRQLLQQNESQGRESGALELEQLEQQLERLIEDQLTDSDVLESWNPAELGELEPAREALERARHAEMQGARLDQAAAEMERAANQLETDSSPAAREAARERLAAAAEQAERHERVSSDEAAARAAEALERALQALERAESGEADPAGTTGNVR